MNAPQNRFFAPGTEFARIERMFGPDHLARDGRGLGDDGFVWQPAPGSAWVAASDASVEGVHYRLDWVTPARALRKAFLSNLSDLNAMGARTRFALFNLGAHCDWDTAVYESLGATLLDLETRHGFRISGGDTTTVIGSGFFSITVLGTVEGRPLLRSAAQVGDRLYATGSFGGSAAGLELLRAGSAAGGAVSQDTFDSLVNAHLDPAPPLDLGPLLAKLCRSDRPLAAIDVSDGLSSELWHLARQSGCALHLDFEKIPAHPSLSALSPEARRAHLLHGGEEYQLLFTGSFTDAELARLRAIAPVTEIGSVEDGEGVFLREGGETRPLQSGGFEHGPAKTDAG